METLLKPRNNVDFDESKFLVILLSETESEWLARPKRSQMHRLMDNLLARKIEERKKRYKRGVIVVNSEREELLRK